MGVLTGAARHSSSSAATSSPARGEQHVEVVDEVGRLRDEPLVGLRERRRHHLDRLLADLAGDRGDPVLEELRRVRALGAVRARSLIVRHRAGAKHESEPVWQAGPFGRTRRRIASPSQSSRSSSTAMVLPDVAPLCQYSCRERLQNHASPDSRVRRSASASIQASISTRPLPASWTIAACSSPSGGIAELHPHSRSSSRSDVSRSGSSCRIEARSAACATSSASATCARCRATQAITGTDTASATARVISRS